MPRVLINRRRLLVGDLFVLPGDSRRTLYEVMGSDPHAGLIIKPRKLSWFGYMHIESGVVTGSEEGSEMKELIRIPDAVLMRECDVL